MVFNISFDVQPAGFLALLDIAIDCYFAADVLLNLHTAFYDGTGYLVGIKQAPNKHVDPEPDLNAMYLHYAKVRRTPGWPRSWANFSIF